ncbi:MmpL efflux pump, putative, partial [Entamoeba invadens IP1]
MSGNGQSDPLIPHASSNVNLRISDRIFNTIFSVLYHARYIIVAFWFITFLGLCYPAVKFMSSTTLLIHPPKGTPSYNANKIVEEKFPDSIETGQNVITISRIDNTTVLTQYTEDLSKQIKVWLDQQPVVLHTFGYYLLPASNTTYLDSFALQIARHEFVGENGDVTIITIGTDERLFSDIPRFIKHLRKELDTLNTDSAHYYVGVTGFEPASVDLQSEIIVSLFKMDVSVIPIAFVILLWVIKSLPLMIIPLCTMITSFVCSFGVMFLFTFAFSVYGIAPALMASCVSAMSIDYSLFLLTRFSEETFVDQSFYEAVKNTLQHAGRIIATSGGLITLCFVSLCFFPIDVIFSLGFSAALSIFFTVIINLTLTPSLLNMFPVFFSKRGFIPCIKKCQNWAEQKERAY